MVLRHLSHILRHTPHFYTLSLHDALPIWRSRPGGTRSPSQRARPSSTECAPPRLVALPITRSEVSTSSAVAASRSEEHTSELQSRRDIVCRLLLAKTKQLLSIPSLRNEST